MTPAGESYTLKLPDLQRLAKVYNTWLISTAAQQGMQVCDIASHRPHWTTFTMTATSTRAVHGWWPT